LVRARCFTIAGWQIFGTSRQQAWEWSKNCLDNISSYPEAKNIAIVVELTAASTNLIESADDALELMRLTHRSTRAKSRLADQMGIVRRILFSDLDLNLFAAGPLDFSLVIGFYRL
jgi:hypothetical protein